MRERKSKCLIVEDEMASQKVIHGLMTLACPQIHICGIAGSVPEAKQMIEAEQPDVILLDIRLKDQTGFDLLTMFPDRQFEVIILTAHSEFEYAKTAISFGVKEYLLKPVKIADLQAAMAKAITNANEKKTLLISPIYGETLVLPYQDILLIAAEGSYTAIYLISGIRHLISRHLNYFEKQLPPDIFTRCHDGQLVNVNHILAMQKGQRNSILYLPGNLTAKVSTRKRAAISKILKEKHA